MIGRLEAGGCCIMMEFRICAVLLRSAIRIKGKVKVKCTLERATKGLRGIRCSGVPRSFSVGGGGGFNKFS
jgi:hypothetical protein